MGIGRLDSGDGVKVYLATASSEIALAEMYMGRLRAAGHTITFDWTETIRSIGSANPREANNDDRGRWADADLGGALAADIFWLLVPGKPSIGCWVELGAVIANAAVHRQMNLAKYTIVSGDWRSTIFTALANCRFDSHDQALAWVGV